MRKLLEITTGRHPFQVAVIAACPVISAAILITGKSPPSLAAALPAQYDEVWLAALAVGGVGALTGAYWRGELDNGLLIEGSGVSAIGAMVTVYAAALLVVQGATAIGPATFLAAIGVACWWRAMQIARDVRKVWRAQSDGLTETVKLLTDPDDPARPGDA